MHLGGGKDMWFLLGGESAPIDHASDIVHRGSLVGGAGLRCAVACGFDPQNQGSGPGRPLIGPAGHKSCGTGRY